MEINVTQLYFKEIDKNNTPYCLIQYISKLEEKWKFLSGTVPWRYMIEQFEEYIFWIFNLLYAKGKRVAPVIIKKSTFVGFGSP